VTRTWDADWDERKAGKGCPMCSEGRPDDTYGNARVFAGRVSDAYLVRGDIGQPGYTIVIWRGGHIADLTELSDSDATTYLREVLKVARALEAHYKPAKMNLEMLGNTVPPRPTRERLDAARPAPEAHCRRRVPPRRGRASGRAHAHAGAKRLEDGLTAVFAAKPESHEAIGADVDQPAEERPGIQRNEEQRADPQNGRHRVRVPDVVEPHPARR